VGELRLLQLDAADVDRISAILTQYADQDLDLADATLMHLAEREGMETVFTVDYRHFAIYRTSQGKRLSLVPANP
jgi:predicted nucleic acid-binding protein